MPHFLPDWLINLDMSFNNIFALVLFWIPMFLNIIDVFIQIVRQYKSDIKQRNAVIQGDRTYYYPELTIGSLFGAVIVVLVPIVNLWYFVFRTIPRFFGRFYKILDFPLVPPPRSIEMKK